jgi:tetratricopeptide (TPR) repeat protein
LAINILTGGLPPSGHADELLKRPLPINPDRQYAFAQSLYDTRRFARAAAEFERFVFLFPDHSRVFDARFSAAQAYYTIGHYQEAIAACHRMISEETSHPPTSLDTGRVYLLLSRCQVAINNIDQALITLHNLLSTTDEPVIRDDARHLGAWIFIETAQWPKARDWLGAVSLQSRNRYSIEMLTSALTHTDTIPHKNSRLAGLLSILPGGGQLYTGRYQDALISFLLNTLTFWAAIEAFEEDQPVLGGLLGVVGINFYTGNIYSAVNSAHKYNRRATKTFIEGLKRRAGIRLIKGPDNHGGGVQVGISF